MGEFGAAAEKRGSAGWRLRSYQTLPTVYGTLGIVLAIVGSTLMVYGDEKRGEVSAEEQSAFASETSDASGRSEAKRPIV